MDKVVLKGQTLFFDLTLFNLRFLFSSLAKRKINKSNKQ